MLFINNNDLIRIMVSPKYIMIYMLRKRFFNFYKKESKIEVFVCVSYGD